MNFSIFDNDGGFGNLEGARIVVLSGSTTAAGLFSPNFINHGKWIKTALENAGFSVLNVRASTPFTFGAYVLNLEIEIEVFNDFTAEQARRNAMRAIEAYTANYGLNKVYSNTTLSVDFDALPASAPSGSPPSSYDMTKPENRPKDSEAWTEFWKAVGFTAVPSVATVVLVGGVFMVVWMRR